MLKEIDFEYLKYQVTGNGHGKFEFYSEQTDESYYKFRTTNLDRATEILKTVLDRGDDGAYDDKAYRKWQTDHPSVYSVPQYPFC